MNEHGASLSLLEYGILAWSGGSSATLEPLAVFQRAVTKAIINENGKQIVLQN